MQTGRIVQVGHGEELYRSPSHPFVATFLGRVNRIERSEKECAVNVVSVGGLMLPCPTSCSGQKALLVRPEDIEVGAHIKGWGQATVIHRSFLGDRVQLTLDLGDQRQLRADVTRDHAAQLGDTVGLRIAPERLIPGNESTETT
jgi:putative spermidine/putrescine transport system ATP-binding protein